MVATIPKNDYKRGSINIVSFHEMLTVKKQLMNDLGQAPIFFSQKGRRGVEEVREQKREAKRKGKKEEPWEKSGSRIWQ